jgi:ribose-phosphate pyrophosphokinase
MKPMGSVAAAPEALATIERNYEKRLLVFGGRASQPLADRISEQLGVTPGEVDLKTFANGEIYCRYKQNVRGSDVFIVQSIAANPAVGLNLNDAFVELLEMIDAAKRASAHKVIAVIPWYGYARQDKKSKPREPITARMVATCLEAIGVDRVVTMDLHAGAIQGFFKVPVDHLTATPMLADYLEETWKKDGNLVVVSPDAGRVKHTRNFARRLGVPWAVMEKERPKQQVAKMGYVVGDVKGKTALLVDDMIDTAGTLCAAAEALQKEGAKRVIACATHGVFSPPAYERLAASDIEQVIVADTHPLPDGKPAKIEVLSSARFFSDVIRHVFMDGSVSGIFAGENQLF